MMTQTAMMIVGVFLNASIMKFLTSRIVDPELLERERAMVAKSLMSTSDGL